MSIQKNLLIGAGVLGVVLVTSQLVSGETVKDNDDKNKNDESSIICYSQTDGSTTTIIGVSPVCPTGYSLTPPADESDGGDDGEKTCPEGKVRKFNTSSDSWECVQKKKDKINKKAYIAANIVEASPIPGGSLIGKLLKTPEGRKAIKKGIANSEVGKKYKAGKSYYNKKKKWARSTFGSEAEETHSNINSSQSFMSEFF